MIKNWELIINYSLLPNPLYFLNTNEKSLMIYNINIVQIWIVTAVVS